AVPEARRGERRDPDPWLAPGKAAQVGDLCHKSDGLPACGTGLRPVLVYTTMLTFPRLVLRNLRYHWRGNLAVLLGVPGGSAVLTGALLVGDSLRGSLRQRAERQLGGIDAAALLPRPIRAAVADGMPGNPAPVLLLPGSIQTTDADSRYIGRVTVLGVDDR